MYIACIHINVSQIYNRINDKVVGLLIRARKKDLLNFDGEMLYQGKDDDEWIYLTRSINTIRVYFGRDGDIIGGGDVDPDVMENSSKVVLDDRRNSGNSIISLPGETVKSKEDTLSILALGSSAIAVATTLEIPNENMIRENIETITTEDSPLTKPKQNGLLSTKGKGLRSSFR